MVRCLPKHLDLLPTIKLYYKDKSWRARYALLEHLKVILEPLASSEDFLTEILALLRDSEPEVRCMALDNLGYFVEKVPKSVA